MMRNLLYTPWIALGFAIMLALTGCASTVSSDVPEAVQSIQALDQKCIAYGTALRSLAVLRVQGELSLAQINMVEYARTIADPICGPDGNVNGLGWREALRRVELAMFEMAFIQGEIR